MLPLEEDERAGAGGGTLATRSGHTQLHRRHHHSHRRCSSNLHGAHQKWRSLTYRVLSGRSRLRAAVWFNRCLAVLVILNVAAFIAESVEEIEHAGRQFFYVRTVRAACQHHCHRHCRRPARPPARPPARTHRSSSILTNILLPAHLNARTTNKIQSKPNPNPKPIKRYLKHCRRSYSWWST